MYPNAAPARSKLVSSMLPPASIDPTTVSAFASLLAPSDDNRSRWSTSSPSLIRCANAAAVTSPAFGTRFVSVKLNDNRHKS